jgi:uncharacterized membrane protein
MKRLFTVLILSAFLIAKTSAQEYFIISHYDVNVTINKDASLDITEIINAHFTEPRHGIIRKIPYKYKVESLPAGVEKASLPMESGGYNRTIIEDIKVNGWDFDVGSEGDYKVIKIGSADKTVDGEQQYTITYRVLNAINFFKDHSEFYFNLIGNEWATVISAVSFKITLPGNLPDTSNYFVATGATGSRDNDTKANWVSDNTFSGNTTRQLNAYEGLTVGISFPDGYLIKPDYRFNGIYWLLLPLIIFPLMLYLWKRWGKDDEVVVQTEYYPPDNISPGVSGYIIDGRLDRRDLTALVPYWGAGGYLQINETESRSFFGLVKNKEYEFIKLKNLPSTTPSYERTFFNGIFRLSDNVKLKDLKDVLYTYMNTAKQELKAEINRDDYYVKYSRGLAGVLLVIGIIIFVAGIMALINFWYENKWMGTALVASGIIVIIFGSLMSKKTQKGTKLYQKLLGFKEFIKSVEKDRIQEFLKQDANYFDKVLPYAIVFDVADQWKDKLKGLDIPPPTWYHGYYAGSNFSTMTFMNSLDNSMRAMTSTFYSTPHSSGSSGGSFGGGGSSGGGFGGGGGSSW